MNSQITMRKIIADIHQFLENSEDLCDSNSIVNLLEKIESTLSLYIENGIDFKTVVDSIDDSILITDATGKVIYVNPNYEINTGINSKQLLGRTVKDIVKEGTLFTGGAVLDVISTQKKAFRLSNVTITTPPKTGYVIGVPIFDEKGNLSQVVASSRPIMTLKALQEDFEQFLTQANALVEKKSNTCILPNASVATPFSRLIGTSPQLQNICETIFKVSPTDATVLITGESGVGKEIVADEIYRLSSRSNKTFIKVNCASIPANLLESELFGYEKGAFSGANPNGKHGIFEMANGGTLLLDEIGDMPLDLQAKLLRAIQNREITRVGGTKNIPLDIRFIAATNNNLKKKISEGTFRQDLYYRLNVIPIHIPPLRERKEDIRQLCTHFIKCFCEKHNRSISLNESNLLILESYDWPGNIRELENVIEYITICSSGENDINEFLLKGILATHVNDDSSFNHLSLTQAVEEYEKKLIESVLFTSKSLREASKILGVNASTISRKVKQYGIKYSRL